MYCMAWKISPLSFWRWCLNCRQRSVRSVAILILPIFQSARPLWVRAKWKRKLIGPLWKDTINLIMIHRGCHNGMLVASIIICLLQKKNTSCVIGQVSQLSYLVDYKIFSSLEEYTMPWNRLETSMKIKFRVGRMNSSATQLGNWSKIIIKIREFFYFWDVNLGWYIKKSEKTSHSFFKNSIFQCCFSPLCSLDSKFFPSIFKILEFLGFHS